MRRLSLFVVAVTAVFPALFATSQVPQSASKKPIVILVTIDGFPARALDDPRLPMPTLRALAAQGVQAKGMVPINPTVTWPNHTAILTGVDASRHYVMANGLITFPKDGSAPEIKPRVDKDKLVHARTLYDAAADKGLSTGQVDWVAVYGAHGIQWQFGEWPDVDGQIPTELVANGLATREQIASFSNSNPAWRDEIWTDAAIDIIKKHTPDLLLFHLLQTDTLQHQNGPLTPAAYAGYAYADTCLGRLVEAVHVAGLASRTTFFILSDHGFTSSTHAIHPNALLAEQGLLKNVNGSYKGTAWAVAEGGAAEVFLRDKSEAASLVPQLKQKFLAVPGIEAVYTNQEARAIGIPSTADTDQAPDLYVTAKEGYSFDAVTEGPTVSEIPLRGQHGYSNQDPKMQALFIASGAAVRSGANLGVIPNLRVAPTIAKILGLSLPDAKQPPLTEVLR